MSQVQRGQNDNPGPHTVAWWWGTHLIEGLHTRRIRLDGCPAAAHGLRDAAPQGSQASVVLCNPAVSHSPAEQPPGWLLGRPEEEASRTKYTENRNSQVELPHNRV